MAGRSPGTGEARRLQEAREGEAERAEYIAELSRAEKDQFIVWLLSGTGSLPRAAFRRSAGAMNPAHSLSSNVVFPRLELKHY